MALTPTTLLALYRLVAKEIAYTQGQATGGSTATIIDTSGDSPMEAGDTSGLYGNSFVMIEGNIGVDVAVSNPTAPQGEIRRIAADGYAPGTGTLTVRNGFTAAVASGHDYGIYGGVPPERVGTVKGIKEFINEALRNIFYRERFLLSLAADADMEASGVTSWTILNSATLVKETTTGIGKGTQSLKVTDPGTGTGGAAQTFEVVPGQSYAIAVDVTIKTAGTGSGPQLLAYDVSQSANITTVSGTAGAFQTRTLSLTASIPAGCKRMQVQLNVPSTSGVFCFKNLSVREINATELSLPSWFSDPAWLEKIIYSIPGGAVTSYGSDPRNVVESGPISQPLIVENRTGGTPYAVQVYPPLARADGHVYAQCLHPYTELANLASSTTCNSDLVMNLCAAAIKSYLGKKDEAAAYAARAESLNLAYNAGARPQRPVQMKDASF
jgi:hypothetical protein